MGIMRSMADMMGGRAPGDKMEEGHEDGGKHTTLHDHGDGTFHTETHDGEREEHAHIGHALMHMAMKHGGEGKHMHTQESPDGSHTSHHTSGESVEGPHDHENLEALKNHMSQFFDEEEQENGEDGGHNEDYHRPPAPGKSSHELFA